MQRRIFEMQLFSRQSHFLVLIYLARLFTVSTEEVLQRPASVRGLAPEWKNATFVENLDDSLPKSLIGVKIDKSSPKNSACIQDSNYDPCIDPSLIDGYCSCDSDTRTITVYRGSSTSLKDDYYLRYCLDEFAKFAFFRYFALHVVGFTDMELRGDILGGMKFDEVVFVDTKISLVDSIFLAGSRTVISVLKMDYIVANEIPMIEASCLKELVLEFESTEVLKIRGSNFLHLTEVQILALTSNATIHVGRNTFKNLPSLEHLVLLNAVSLTYGSLAFKPLNRVQKIELGNVYGLSPGAINNLMDVDLSMIYNAVGWSPAVWFNFLALGGGTLSSRAGPGCSDCQHAWMRRAFMPAASQVRCYNAMSPPSTLESFTLEQFSHC